MEAIATAPTSTMKVTLTERAIGDAIVSYIGMRYGNRRPMPYHVTESTWHPDGPIEVEATTQVRQQLWIATEAQARVPARITKTFSRDELVMAFWLHMPRTTSPRQHFAKPEIIDFSPALPDEVTVTITETPQGSAYKTHPHIFD